MNTKAPVKAPVAPAKAAPAPVAPKPAVKAPVAAPVKPDVSVPITAINGLFAAANTNEFRINQDEETWFDDAYRTMALAALHSLPNSSYEDFTEYEPATVTTKVNNSLTSLGRVTPEAKTLMSAGLKIYADFVTQVRAQGLDAVTYAVQVLEAFATLCRNVE